MVHFLHFDNAKDLKFYRLNQLCLFGKTGQQHILSD